MHWFFLIIICRKQSSHSIAEYSARLDTEAECTKFRPPVTYVGFMVRATDWFVLSRLPHVILPKFFNGTLAGLFYLKEIQYLTIHYPHLLSI